MEVWVDGKIEGRTDNEEVVRECPGAARLGV